jgi:predicted HTH domain antitoxin
MEGEMRRAIDMALRMIQDGILPLEKIAQYSGLPLEKIQELAGAKTA